MASKNKTTETNASIDDFLLSFVNSETKRADSYKLIELMKKWSGYEPKMWGPSIIGFGSYHYKYTSGHEGDSMLIGFSPRKAAISLYVAAPELVKEKLLPKLGKFKMGKGCIYVKQLNDLNIPVLEELSKEGIKYIQANHECACREN